MDRNQIKVLIRQMTLEEKAGQVTQLPSRYFAIQGSQLTGTETKLGISEEKKWLCGSILGKLDAVSMRNIQKENLERSRLQIVYDGYCTWVSDNISGTVGYGRII